MPPPARACLVPDARSLLRPQRKASGATSTRGHRRLLLSSAARCAATTAGPRHRSEQAPALGVRLPNVRTCAASPRFHQQHRRTLLRAHLSRCCAPSAAATRSAPCRLSGRSHGVLIPHRRSEPRRLAFSQTNLHLCRQDPDLDALCRASGSSASPSSADGLLLLAACCRAPAAARLCCALDLTFRRGPHPRLRNASNSIWSGSQSRALPACGKSMSVTHTGVQMSRALGDLNQNHGASVRRGDGSEVHVDVCSVSEAP